MPLRSIGFARAGRRGGVRSWQRWIGSDWIWS